MSIFTGAGVAIITPFHADGSVNYEKLDELIQSSPGRTKQVRITQFMCKGVWSENIWLHVLSFQEQKGDRV